MPDSDDLGSIVFALGADGGLRYVDDVPNGKQCGCVCPACKQPLIARNEGKKLAHHFAHVSGSCEWAVEAAVAYTVEEQVRQAGRVWLPPLVAQDSDVGCEVVLSPAHVMPAAAASLREISGRHAPEVVVTVRTRSGKPGTSSWSSGSRIPSRTPRRRAFGRTGWAAWPSTSGSSGAS